MKAVLRIALGAIVLALACPAICSGIWTIVDYLCRQDTVLADLDAGNNRAIIVSAKSCWEVGRAVFYVVEDKGKVVSPTYFFNVDDGSHNSYSLVYAENKSLVGVLDTTTPPPELVIIYDFTSNASWSQPYSEATTPQWRNIFLRLQHENPQLLMPRALKE